MTPPAAEHSASSILITGGSGLLGRALMRELAEFDPLGTALTRLGPGLVPLDLLDREAVTACLTALRPAVIIHAAAERRPDASEADPQRAEALNVAATAHLAELAAKLGSWLLYLSTDYVFDGTRPPYGPADAPTPINFYGRTKLAGETAIREATERAAILRVGVLFGRVQYPAESSVLAAVDEVRAGKPVKVDDWAARYPIFTDDLAVLIRQIAESRLSGTFHWCGAERLTKYGQAVAIGEALGVSTAHLTPNAEPPAGAPRPRDCRLDCSLLEDRGLGRRTPFRRALEVSLRESGLLDA